MQSCALSASDACFDDNVMLHKKCFKNLFILPVLFDKLYKADYNADLELPVRYR